MGGEGTSGQEPTSKGGRPKTRIQSTGTSPKPELETWRRFRIRATVQELAYDKRVPATPISIHKLMRMELELAQLDPPLIGEQREPEQNEIFERERDAILDKYERIKVPSNSKYTRLLLGEREASRQTLDEIQIVSLDAYVIHQHGFWPAYALQPSDHEDYWRLGNRFQEYLNRVVGCRPVTWDRKARKRPQDSVIREFREVDSLDILRYYMLLFGAAHEAGWPDLYQESFQRILAVTSKVAALPPFSPFAQEFASDVVGSILRGGRPVPIDRWQQSLKECISDYQGIIDLAADTQIIPRTAGNPYGERFDQQHLLKYADFVGRGQLHVALNSYKLNKKAPPLCTRFIDWLKRFDLDAPF